MPNDTIDDAADTLRFVRLDLDAEAPSDPDATSIYDLRSAPPPRYACSRRGSRVEHRENRDDSR